MRIIRCQIQMSDVPEENLHALRHGLRLAKNKGAELVLMPELSLSGFHRDVKSLYNDRVMDSVLKSAMDFCAQYGVGALVGLPYRDNGSAARNMMVAIDRYGRISHMQAKVGLTSSEQLFFSPAQETNIWIFDKTQVAIIMCREVLDLERLRPLYGRIKIFLWPSYVQWEAGVDDYQASAERLARRSKAWVLQANWSSAINDSTLRNLGGSILVNPSGKTVDVAARDKESFRTFDLATP